MDDEDEYPFDRDDFGYRPWEDGPFRGGIEEFPASLRDLPERWKLALLFIRDGRLAFCPVSRVPSYGTVVAEMVAAGLILTSEWVRTDKTVVTLSPLAAERLQVEIDERGPKGDPVWVPIRYDLEGKRLEITAPIEQPVQRGMVRLGSVDYLPLERREIDELARIVKAKEKAKIAKRKQRELRRKSA